MMTTYLASSPILATSSVCPKCGQPTTISFGIPEPGFYVMVRINSEPLRLADPLEIGGQKIYTSGHYERTEIIPIVRVHA